MLYNSYNQEKSVPTQNLPIINNSEVKLSSIYIKANYTVCHVCDRHVYQNATSETYCLQLTFVKFQFIYNDIYFSHVIKKSVHVQRI